MSRNTPGRYLAATVYAGGGEYPVFGSNTVMGSHTQYLYDGPFSVLARIGSNCGALRYSPSPAWVNNNASAIMPKAGTPGLLLHAMLRAIPMEQYRIGSGQPFVQTTDLMQHRVPDLQLSAAEKTFSGELSQMLARLQAEHASGERLYGFLLNRLLSGDVLTVPGFEAA